jgi:hypothetical protein
MRVHSLVSLSQCKAGGLHPPYNYAVVAVRGIVSIDIAGDLCAIRV